MDNLTLLLNLATVQEHVTNVLFFYTQHLVYKYQIVGFLKEQDSLKWAYLTPNITIKLSYGGPLGKQLPLN